MNEHQCPFCLGAGHCLVGQPPEGASVITPDVEAVAIEYESALWAHQRVGYRKLIVWLLIDARVTIDPAKEHYWQGLRLELIDGRSLSDEYFGPGKPFGDVHLTTPAYAYKFEALEHPYSETIDPAARRARRGPGRPRRHV